MANNQIYIQATTLLAVVNDIFADAGVALPSRQFIYAGQGQPPHDCDQVVVVIELMKATFPDGSGQSYARPNAVNTLTTAFTVYIIRGCWPTMQGDGREFPAPATMSAASEISAIDMYLLFVGLLVKQGAGEMFATCQNVFIAPCIINPPRGQYNSVACSIFVEPDLGPPGGSM